METRNAVILVLWLIFFVTFGRAVSKSKSFRPAGQRIWLMFFLSVLAFTFWGEAAEASLDQHFHELPVALYLKYVCLIGVCHLYLQLLREVGSYPQRRTPAAESAVSDVPLHHPVLRPFHLTMVALFLVFRGCKVRFARYRITVRVRDM